MNLRAMLDARRNDEDSDANNYPVYFFFNDGLAAPVLAFSTSICMFCVQCMRVIWPRVFTGERHSAMSWIVSNEWRMLIDPMRHNLMSIIDLVM